MTATEVEAMRGREVVDRDGDKVGTVEEVYLDRETNKPEWVLVSTGGLIGKRSMFVPLAASSTQEGALRVPYEKDQIKSAPQTEAEGELSQDEEAALYRHYGLDYSEARSGTGLPEGQASYGGGPDATREDSPGVVGEGRAGYRDLGRDTGEGSQGFAGDRTRESSGGGDVSGRETDSAMTRSEEEVHVGTTQREAGRARLRKYVVTDQVTKTVPVKREEVRVEREPITDANVGDATSGPDLSDEEHEVTLMEEEVVVDKRAVPKERVRLDKETVAEEREISEEVRREEIEMADAEGAPARGHAGERGADEGLGRR